MQRTQRSDRLGREAAAQVRQQEALSTGQSKQLPATADAGIRKLRAEMHRRMLGNGYCAGPVGLDCHFDSICESCTFFQTTLECRPNLQRHRDDAANDDSVGRQEIFDGLLARLAAQAS